LNNYLRLDHPNILKLYHSFEDDEKFYIVSELCEGGTLSQFIDEHYPLKEVDIVKIMKQLIGSINFAHKKNIIHRDIKPENILIDDEVTT
jgi:calcium-dependent protein kinase